MNLSRPARVPVARWMLGALCAVVGLAGAGAVPATAAPGAAAPGDGVVAFLEVEDGVISGNPGYNQGDHSNFTGAGSYTFRETGMRSTMTVDAPAAGVYPVYVRYSAGPLSAAENVTRSMGLVTNGVRQQLQYPLTGDWETWRFVRAEVTLLQGANTIALDCDRSQDICRLNFDAIQVGGTAPDPCAATAPSAGFRNLFDGTLESFDRWRKAGAGGFGRQADCTVRSFRGRGAEWLTDQQTAPYTLKVDWRRAAADDESSLYLASSSRGGADPVGGLRIPIGTDTGAVVPTGGTMKPADRTAVSRALRPVGEWNRYVVQVTTGRVKVYLNGSQVNTYDATQPLATTGFIGLENRGEGHTVDFRKIQVADGVVPDPDGGVSFVPVHYAFEEGTGTTAANTGTDQSVGPATLTGATGWSPDGVHGKAVDLPGGSNANAVDLPDNLLQGETDFTTSFWARPDTKGNWIGMFHIGDGLGNDGSFFQIQMQTQANGNTGLAATFKKKGSAVQERVYAVPTKDVAAGAWNHVVFTRQGATGTLYLNGQQIAQRADLTITMADVGPTTNNWLGRNGFPDPAYDGRMDDVRLYETSLSAQDVAGLYADGTALDTTTTVSVSPASPSAFNQPITVSATVADESATGPEGAPDGQGELFVDGARVGTPQPVTDGAVTFPEVTLSPGTHQIEVRFLAAAGWNDSSGTTQHTVQRPPPTSGVPVHYTFDEGQGTTAANSGTSTTVGPATLTGSASWAAGQCAGAVSLPGGPNGPASGSSHVNLPNDITAGMDAEITISTWLRPTALPGWTTHVQIGKSTAEYLLLQSSTFGGDRGFGATLRVDGGEDYRILLPGETDLPLNEWTHVVVTLGPSPTGGGTTGRIYFDGVLMEGGTRDNIPVDIGDVGEGGTTANFIGNTSWNDPRPTELVDEFRIYGYELTAQQVAELTTQCPAVNRAPAGSADAYSTPEGTPLSVAAPGVLANDTDADSDPLTATGATQPANGTVTVAADGGFTYTPAAGFAGTDTFTYRANDGKTTSAATTVTITVERAVPGNRAPTAGADAYEAVAGQVLTVPAPGVLMNDADADGEALTATDLTQPTRGTVVLARDGSFTYTPNAGFTGTDSFTYRASDGKATSAPATVTITVKPAGGGTATTAVSGAALPVTYGQSGSVSAVVSPESATGTVELRKGATLLAAADLLDGRATLALAARSLPVGEHVLDLRYGGDARHRASSATVTVTVLEKPVTKSTSRTVAKVAPRRLDRREDFQVTTRVTSILAGSPTPTGTVKIRIDGRLIKVGRLTGGRHVLRVRKNLNVGRHMLSVTYSGDSQTWWSRDRQWFYVKR